MLNSRILAVVKRELKQRLLSKSFIISTLLIPVFIFGIILVQGAMIAFKGDKNTNLEIVTESPAIQKELQSVLSADASLKESKYTISYKNMSRNLVEKYIQDKNKELVGGKLDGIFFIPDAALKTKAVEYYSKTPTALAVTSKISGSINACLMSIYFKEKNIAPEELNYARSSVSVKTYKISEKKAAESAGAGDIVLAFVFSFLLYMSLIIIGSTTMQSVLEEKNNRVVEVLLSSVRSGELLAGKILGVAITGVLQMAIWMLPAFCVVGTSMFKLPPNMSISITPMLLLFFLYNYFIGIITFTGLFASVGAIFDNAQDAQSGVWPIMLAIMIPFFATFSMINNPNNPITNIGSLLPLASIIIMPAKMAIADVAAWKVALSALINLATLIAVFKLAGKIYRVGILQTGTKPTWSDVLKWIQYRY
jgi:ABC-2 type transport system permease protein